MEQEVFNFKRFFGLFKRLAYIGDRDELRRGLVSQYTNGRTDELRYIRESEYEALCASLERELSVIDEVSLKHKVRKKRSVCLKLMQKLGVDTTDWSRVNALCRDARICGKDFYPLTVEELDALSVKLRSIERKGGLKPQGQDSGQGGGMAFIIPINIDDKYSN
ncbi:hypothetical protein E5358_04905 [Palleniella muris]|uniref:Uncharacterized protein n=1 Tax=Palleniella muris TaxID=3038145 RepID=A0AC61QRF9_9BACT|nr:hypothetical protein [Palleniella muris]TGX83002.1 hypothetical protein E5358_04905 [Palleniella muris]